MSQSTAVVNVDQNRRQLSTLLEQMKPQLRMALPRHLTPERLIRVAITAWNRTQGLQECSPMSILGSVVQAAQLGLEPDSVLGHAYLVPFYNNKTGQKECQLITGYKGLLDLARRSGQIEAIESRCVYERDHFVYRLGLQPQLAHVPSEEAERGEITHAWAIARFKGGGHQYEVMSRAEIDKIRKGSKAANSGPWVSHFEEMARKTVLRRLCKFLPLSPEIQRQISAEEMADAGIIESTIIDGAAAPVATIPADNQSKTDKVAARLGAKTNGQPKPVEPEQVNQTADQESQEQQAELDRLALGDEFDQQLESAQDIDALQRGPGSFLRKHEDDLGPLYSEKLKAFQDKYKAMQPKKAAKKGEEMFAGAAGPYGEGF